MQALPHPRTTLTVSVILAILVVFFGDIITPLGYAEVILYLVPLLLSSFLYEPQLPIRIAGATTVLAAAGFVLSPPGAPAVYAMLNRTTTILVLWTAAFGLRRLIRDRQTHLHEEQRWQLLAHQTNDILWDWDLRTSAHWWSDNAIDTFGYEPMQEPSIVVWHSRIHPDDQARIQTSIQSAIESGQSGWSDKYQFRMHDSTYRTFFDRVAILRNESGTAIRMIGAMMDVTEQIQTEDQLRQAYAQLQDVTRHAAKAEENERRRIAREIHDELGQLVTAMRFQLTSLKKDLAAKSPVPDTANRTARLNDLLELSHTMLNQVRHVSISLRPAILDELGLIPAVQAHAQQLKIAPASPATW